MKRKISIVLITLFLLSMLPLSIYADTENSVTIRAPAVKKTDTGYEGAVLSITVSTKPGNGHIYVDTWPLTELDTQASARLAVEVAGRVTGKDVNNYDFYYVVRSDSPVIGGPSAGGVITIATIASLEGWKIKDDVMMTGMINPDSTIGPVGGIVEKLDASAELGITKFLVPWGETVVTTQTTTKEERNGVVQIVQKSKKVNVVEYAKKQYDIEVIEVKDINDALLHFVGKNFSEKEVKGEITISTSFLSERANNALEKNITYHDTIAQELSSLNVSNYEKNYLQEYLNRTQELIETAKQEMNNAKYYTALSTLLNAEIYTGIVDEYIHIDSVDTRLQNLTKKLEEIDTKLKEKRTDIKGIASLEFLSAAEKRLKEAYDYLERAKNYKENLDIENTAYSIAYADKRADTAILWLDMAVKHSGGKEISLDQLKEDAWKRIEEAKLVYVYVSSMMGESSLPEASNSLNAAQNEYDTGRYTSALFYALESKVYSSIAIELGMSGEDLTVVSEKIQRAKEDAKIAIQLARETGHEPLLAECYYEYASNFEEKQDAVNAFRMYKYAKEVASAYKHLGMEGTEVPTVVTTPTSTPIKTPATTMSENPETGSTLILIMGSGLVGLFVGILIGSAFKRE